MNRTTSKRVPLTVPQRVVLGFLYARGAVANWLIARHVDRPPEGVAQTASSLVRRGLLTRVVINGLVCYRITPRGIEALSGWVE